MEFLGILGAFVVYSSYQIEPWTLWEGTQDVA